MIFSSLSLRMLHILYEKYIDQTVSEIHRALGYQLCECFLFKLLFQVIQFLITSAILGSQALRVLMDLQVGPMRSYCLIHSPE